MTASPSPTREIVVPSGTFPSLASPSIDMAIVPPTPISTSSVVLLSNQQSCLPSQLECVLNNLETPLSAPVVQHEPGLGLRDLDILTSSVNGTPDNSLKLDFDGSFGSDNGLNRHVSKGVEISQNPFIPLQGAWKKPLSISKLMITEERDSQSSPSQWPSLSVGQKLTKRQMQEKSKIQITKDDQPLDDIICSKRIEDNIVAQRFPWAAKMNPATRNLYRATSPTYMDDGTPKVQIPNHVLLKGLENQKEFIIGQFYRCSTPSAGLIHALVNKIWVRKCKIFIRKLGESSYMFHIPDASTRTWVIQRGLWHLDDCLMFVAPWSPTTTLALTEISTMPVWVTLKNIPNQLYSIQGISWIASGLGAPMATNKPRLDLTLMGEAKILVEVELNKPFPQKIAAEDKKGMIWMIDVEYSWLPSKCGRCNQLGHKESRCLNLRQAVVASPNLETLKTPLVPKTSTYTTEEVNVVVIPTITSEANVVSSDTSLDTIEDVSIPIMEAPTEERPREDHEITPIVVEATPIVEVCVTSSKITSTPETSTLSSPNLLVFESNACGTMIRDEGVIITPESSDTDVDLVMPSSQRVLRERPVQPSLKYDENEWISISTCRRSKCSRGGRRGRFD